MITTLRYKLSINCPYCELDYGSHYFQHKAGMIAFVNDLQYTRLQCQCSYIMMPEYLMELHTDSGWLVIGKG